MTYYPDALLALARFLALALPCQSPDCPKWQSAVQDVLYLLPELSVSDWEKLHHWESALSRREALSASLQVLQTYLKRPLTQRALCSALREVSCAEDSSPPFGTTFERFLELALDGDLDATVKAAQQAFRPLIEKRMASSDLDASSPTALWDYLKKRAQNWRQGDLELPLSEHDTRKLCLAAILIARIANADKKVDFAERNLWQQFLEHHWQLSADEAFFVVKLSLNDGFSDVDLVRIGRWYHDLTCPHERENLIELLFAIAGSDGDLSDKETDEVLNIAASQRDVQSVFHRAFVRHGGTPEWPLATA